MSMTEAECGVSDQEKGQGIFWIGRNALYLDCGGAYIFQNSSNYILLYIFCL